MINIPKGTKDVLPQESYKWHHIEGHMRAVCAAFGYREIRTPVFEHTELFLRGVGDTTDIVQKEMYTFLDKGDRSITLKPEGTAGVARSFIENGLFNEAQPTKLYYVNCPVFRYEKPQAGRLREHHQFGVEVFGAAQASVDAEVISVALELFRRLGVGSLALNINSIGCPKCRPAYHERFKEALAPKLEQLCENCRARFDKNPFRILDCKELGCQAIAQDAPKILDYLCPECEEHFAQLQEGLRNLDIDYSINPMIVRGLDYYTKTVFEIISNNIGAQGTVCGGGRYDGLIEAVGGPATPGIGFGMGMERLLLVMQNTGIEIRQPRLYDVLFCTMGEEARKLAQRWTQALRRRDIAAEADHMGRGMKAQMKYANKTGSKYVVVLGDDEVAGGAYKLKDMETGREMPFGGDDPVDEIFNLIMGGK